MDYLKKLFKRDKSLSVNDKDQIASLLKTTPQALEAFEEVYRDNILMDTSFPDNFFDVNAKQAASSRGKLDDAADMDKLIGRIVKELMAQADIYSFDGEHEMLKCQRSVIGPAVTREEIEAFPKNMRPQLTGFFMRRDIRKNE